VSGHVSAAVFPITSFPSTCSTCFGTFSHFDTGRLILFDLMVLSNSSLFNCGRNLEKRIEQNNFFRLLARIKQGQQRENQSLKIFSVVRKREPEGMQCVGCWIFEPHLAKHAREISSNGPWKSEDPNFSRR